MISEEYERRANMDNLVAHLISEARINNRIAIVAVCVMAAGKEILSVIK